MLEPFTFWFLALVTLAAALYVALSPNVLRAAFALAGCFAGVAGLYLLLEADFLAAVQFFIYVGGIVVLLVFAVMFTPRLAKTPWREAHHNLALALLSTAVLAVMVAPVLAFVVDSGGERARLPAVGEGTAWVIASLLVGKYLFAFEIAGVLLLAVMIGVLVLVRKETKGETGEPSTE